MKKAMAKMRTNPARQAMLDAVLTAIRENRAYLDTSVGKRLIVEYNDDTGWAVTNNTGNYFDQRSFMVCLDSIKIGPAPLFEDRRVVKHSSFEYEGRTVPTTSIETERVWNW